MLAREGGDSEGSLALQGVSDLYPSHHLPSRGAQSNGMERRSWSSPGNRSCGSSTRSQRKPGRALRHQQEMEIQISVRKGTVMRVRVTRNSPAPCKDPSVSSGRAQELEAAVLLHPALPRAGRSLILQPNETLTLGCAHGTREHRDKGEGAPSLLTWINDPENCPELCPALGCAGSKGSVPHTNCPQHGSCREGQPSEQLKHCTLGFHSDHGSS